MDYGTIQHNTQEEEETTTCCKFEIIDNSEPFIIIGFIASTSGLGLSLVAGTTTLTVITGIASVTALIAEWRIRALGIAKNLMDSVRDLKKENVRLNDSICVLDLENGRLRDEIKKFEEIVGLLDNNVQDIEKAKEQLFELYEKYRQENFKQESNNLLTLFGLVDRNEDSRLSSEELERLREYIKIVYRQDIDFDILDKDDDGYVSLQEFFEKFRGKLNKKL